MNGELVRTGIEAILSPLQLKDKKSVPKTLTPIQKALQDGSTASQLVNDWSGTIAQLNCNVTLSDVVAADNIPTLADVGRSFSNSTAIEIITKHLQSVLRYAGVELTDAQLAETALSILSSYWYLNMAELCIFFCQLKNGSRGQFVWGSRINNQAIMVALSDFCKDRCREIERKENERIQKQVEKGFSRLEDFSKNIVIGTVKVREQVEIAKRDYTAFCEFFPYLPDKYAPEVLWKAWGGEKDALRQIYGENVPPVEVTEKDIGSYLCEYNIVKSRGNERT